MNEASSVIAFLWILLPWWRHRHEHISRSWPQAAALDNKWKYVKLGCEFGFLYMYETLGSLLNILISVSEDVDFRYRISLAKTLWTLCVIYMYIVGVKKPLKYGSYSLRLTFGSGAITACTVVTLQWKTTEMVQAHSVTRSSVSTPELGNQ